MAEAPEAPVAADPSRRFSEKRRNVRMTLGRLGRLGRLGQNGGSGLRALLSQRFQHIQDIFHDISLNQE